MIRVKYKVLGFVRLSSDIIEMSVCEKITFLGYFVKHRTKTFTQIHMGYDGSQWFFEGEMVNTSTWLWLERILKNHKGLLKLEAARKKQREELSRMAEDRLKEEVKRHYN